MAAIGTVRVSLSFWANRKWHVVVKDNNTNARVRRLNDDIASRKAREIEASKKFLSTLFGSRALGTIFY